MSQPSFMRALALAATLAAGVPSVQGQAVQPQVAWTASMSLGQVTSGGNYTCRWIARPSIAGNTVRIRLSNLYSQAAQTYDAVSLAHRTTRAAVSGIKPVTFGGSRSVTIPAGQWAVSDPVAFQVGLHEDVAISVYTAAQHTTQTWDNYASTTSYCTDDQSGTGDHTADTSDASFTIAGAVSATVDAFDVYTSPPTGAVVAFGDSITNGVASDLDGNDRWVDVLSNRFLNLPVPKSVVNEGIAGDTACPNGGNGLVNRFDRDVLALSGVSHVILFAGTNDLGLGGSPSSVIGCYQNVIARARAAGLGIVGGTMIPRRSFGPAQESYRQQINAWIRTPGNFDGFIDFDAAVREPADPGKIRPMFDGDQTHPSPAGYLAMGNAVDLSLFGRVARVNLALNRPVTADSSCTPTQGPEKAANGSFADGLDDKWCSSGSAPAWQVDLGAVYDVNQFVIGHAGAGGESPSWNTRAYRIRISPDGVSWSTPVTVATNTAAVTADNIAPAKARHVRLEVTTPQQAPGGAARIYDMQVYGTMWSPCAVENGVCNVGGATNVRYGAGDTYVSRIVSGSTACTSAAFGVDPVPGIAKHCDAAPTWAACAGEGGMCNFSGSALVQYGAAGKYAYKLATNSQACSVAGFGIDPNFGVPKTCSWSPPPSADNGWTKCSGESGTCSFAGTRSVAYGVNQSWAYRAATGSIACNPGAFGGDPAYGIVKGCFYK